MPMFFFQVLRKKAVDKDGFAEGRKLSLQSFRGNVYMGLCLKNTA